jgi:hypothetical protein
MGVVTWVVHSFFVFNERNFLLNDKGGPLTGNGRIMNHSDKAESVDFPKK